MDQKILIAGNFQTTGTVIVNHIARLNTDGSLDTSFYTGTGINNKITAIALQPDGKIIIGGDFTSINGISRNRIARLLPNGDLDLGFNVGTGANSSINSIELQSDGKIVIAGFFTSINDISRSKIARLNTDGSLDTGFDVGTGFYGSGGGVVNCMKIQSDGKIIIGGSFTSFNNVPRASIARLNADGSLDTGFDLGIGDIIDGNDVIYSLALDSEGKILIAGNLYINGIIRNQIAQFNANGSIDNGYERGLYSSGSTKIELQSNGKILLSGYVGGINNIGKLNFTRLNANGSVDMDFNAGTGVNEGVIKAIAVQPADGKIIIGGTFTIYNNTSRNKIARLNTDGSLDTGFNADIGTDTNHYVDSITLQQDGKIIIGGWFTSINGIARRMIARLNADGSLDTGFDPGTGASTWIYTTAVQSDGKILIGGYFTSYNGYARSKIARLNADGSLDTTFNIGSGFNNDVNDIKIQSDGKIVIGGIFTVYNGNTSNYLARLNADGSIDTGFNVGIGPSQPVKCIEVLSSGKILVGGNFSSWNSAPKPGLARLNINGSLDNSFTLNYGVGVENFVILADGKMLLTGFFNYTNNLSCGGTITRDIVLVDENGYRDSVFTSNICSGGTMINEMAIQNNGKVLLGGTFTQFSGVGKNRLVSLNVYGNLGLDEHIINKLILYPNPANSILNVQTNNNDSINKIQITDLTGKIIVRQSENTNQVNIENFASGMYIIEAFNGEGKFMSKFMKN